jgi:DNA polymerase
MIINLDIETRSDLELPDVGGFRYAEHPSTRILCYSYKIDGEDEVHSVIGERLTPWLEKNLFHATVRGWNVDGFDVPVWNARFPDCKIGRSDDTMARALVVGIPAKLDKAAQFMGMQIRKDMEGHRLMMRLCRGHNPEPTGEELKRLAEYCDQDVKVEAMLAKYIPMIPEFEERVRALSNRINRRGFMVDLDLARTAVEYATAEQAELFGRIADITDGVVTRHTQRARILNWLNANGCPVPNVQKQTLEDTLNEDDIPQDCRDVIDIRLSGAKASTAKFNAALNTACEDHRVRGTFTYFGAPATGRWSGRYLQPHNLPRDTASNPFTVLSAIKAGEVDSVYKALSSLLRPMIVAPEGKTLVRCDFSAIEGRVVAWLANDSVALAEYRGAGKMYEQAAAVIYGVSAATVTKAQRQIGKVAELALGFGGGWKAFDSMARNYGVKVPPAEAKRIVKKWRAGRPAVVRLWSDVERTAIRAYRNPNNPQAVCGGKVTFIYDSAAGRLWIRLPAGRFICLPDFKVSTYDGPYGPAERLTYKRGNWYPKQGETAWPRADTYGGSLVESLAQGIARDLLAEAMLEYDDDDTPIVLHVHDEMVVEVDASRAEEIAAAMEEVMSVPPAWAVGLPLAAVAEHSVRFGK